LISSIASRPFMPGILISIKIISGLIVSANSIAFLPLTASPTTVISVKLFSINFLIAFLSINSSSAISILNFIPPLSSATGESSSLCSELIQFPSLQESDNVTAGAESHLLNQFLLSGQHVPCQRRIRIEADGFFLDPSRHHHPVLQQ